MLARLAQVIEWTATTVAAVLLGLGVFAALSEQADQFAAFVFLIGPGILIYLAGRAVRFIIVGT